MATTRQWENHAGTANSATCGGETSRKLSPNSYSDPPSSQLGCS